MDTTGISLRKAATFLGIPSNQHTALVRKTTKSSVAAPAFMHSMRRAAQSRQRSDRDNPKIRQSNETLQAAQGQQLNDAGRAVDR